MDASEDVAGLLARYHDVLLEMHDNRIEIGGKPRAWNRLVNRMQSVHLLLRETPEGRQGITELALHDSNQTVRSCSAANALAWDAALVRPILEAEAADTKSLAGFEAKMTLREFDAGRLNTAWVPKR